MEQHIILNDKDRSFLSFNEQDRFDEGRYIETLPSGEAVVLRTYVLKNGQYVHEKAERVVQARDNVYLECVLVDDDGTRVV